MKQDINKDKVKKWYDYYSTMRETMNQSYRYFNNRTMVQYIDDSTERFNGYLPPRTDKYDWQSHVFSNATRNKTMALFAKIGLQAPDVKLLSTDTKNKISKRASSIIHDCYVQSKVKSNASMEYFNETLDCAVKGTVIAYEGYKVAERKIKEIKTYDPLTGDVTFDVKTIKDYDDCYSEICNLPDFFIWNIYEPEVQNQSRIIWRKKMLKDEFLHNFSKYPNVSKVKAGGEMTPEDETEFYKEEWGIDLKSDSVEVLYCYDRPKDEYLIIANGVLLQDTPFPWNHKKYPFGKTVFEKFDISFFYGKSLPDKMLADQDTLNTLYNMALDKTFLSIFPPILDSTINEVEDELLVPGRRMPVEDINSMKELQIKSVDNSHFNMLELVSKNIDLSSVSATQQGQSGSGSTAREVVLAEENARILMGVFNFLLEDLVWQKAKLRIPNILQFYSQPNKVEILKRKGVDEITESFKEIVIDNVVLEDGKTGIKKIRIVGDNVTGNKRNAKNRIAEEERVQRTEEGINMEILEVPASYIRQLDVDISIVKNSGYMTSKSTKMAMELEYIKYVLSLFPDMVNKEALFEDLNEIYEKDNDRLMMQKEPEQEEETVDQAGRGATGQSNTVRQMSGKNQGNISLPTDNEIKNLTT